MLGAYPERTALLVDGSNLWYCQRNLNIDIDYTRFRNYFQKRNNFLGYCGYYTAIRTDNNGDRPIQRLLDYLSDNGWLLVTKDAVSHDEGGKWKGNMDVELTCDALEVANHVDHVILVTGDGDFSYLVERILKKGRKVSVVSSRASGMLAGDLRRAATQVIDLAEIRSDICRLP